MRSCAVLYSRADGAAGRGSRRRARGARAAAARRRRRRGRGGGARADGAGDDRLARERRSCRRSRIGVASEHMAEWRAAIEERIVAEERCAGAGAPERRGGGGRWAARGGADVEAEKAAEAESAP